MASTIKLKNGSGAPLAGDLVQGEPALDLTNKRLYTENASGTVIEVGTNPSSLTIGGTALTATAAELNTLDGITATVTELNVLDGITATTAELNYTDGVTSNIQTQLNAMVEKAGDSMTGNLSFGDNNKAVFGAGSDLQIYHDGSNSRIIDSGTGGLYLQGSSFVSLTNSAATETYLYAAENGAVQLKYDNSTKLATTATGIDVTGTVTADGLTVAVSDGGFASLVGGGGGVAEGAYHLVQDRASFGYLNGKVHIGDISAAGTSSNKNLEIKLADAPRVSVLQNGDISFYEDTGTTAKFFWDASAEALGIGTSSPVEELQIEATVPTIRLSDSDDFSYVNFVFNAGAFALDIDPSNVGSSSKFTVDIDGSEAMRIDSVGNLLVGKTTTSLDVAGVQARANGLFAATRDGGQHYFTRLTSDGSIVDFLKDSTTVGSIGARANFLKITSGDTGLLFNSASDAIYGESSTGGARDAAIDLGVAGVRFKDLYLSGGVYLGGTGAANLLDDYEEGTFTPSIGATTTDGTATYTNQSGKYTKVGNIVFIQLYLSFNSFTGTGDVRIKNLPFTALTQASFGVGGDTSHGKVADAYVSYTTAYNSTEVRITTSPTVSTALSKANLGHTAFGTSGVINLTGVIRIN